LTQRAGLADQTTDLVISPKASNPTIEYDLATTPEISSLARYYDAAVQWIPRREDTGLLLDQIEGADKAGLGENYFPSLSGEKESCA